MTTKFTITPPEISEPIFSNYNLIRHAENDKSNPSGNNRHLTKKGLNRAKNFEVLF